jgi:serine phosphatase RsbU (regulator of sigma subunit)
LLVVDDIADNRDLLVRRLQRLGYHEVETANDGLEALEKNRARPFDAMLLDVMMPRMSGVEVLEAMRANDRLEITPVIMISAATELDTVVRCLELGAEDYLTKPFNPVVLRARLGSVLEKRALRAEVRRQLAVIELELADARRQQLSMVPDEFPSGVGPVGVDVHATLRPARQIGGDLYDCFQVGEDRLCVAVGDVSGKGTPAALFMARTRSLLRAATLQAHALMGQAPSPAAIAAVMNAELCKNNPIGMFVTLFFGQLDLRDGTLTYVCAGHVRPFLLRPGQPVDELVCRADRPLGLFEEAVFHDGVLHLGAGDGMVVISDGVPDMENAAGESFTVTHVRDVLETMQALPAEGITAGLVQLAFEFAAGAPQADDVTVLTLRLRAS